MALDGKTAATGHADGTILIWDVYGLNSKPLFNVDRIWKDLANGTSAAAGFGVVRELCGSPAEAIALLQEKLKPASIDLKSIEGWMKDLSDYR